MAITDYSSLKTTIADYLHRTDLSDTVMSNFVQFAEVRLNRKLRLLQQQTEAALTIASGSRELTLPTDWIETIDLIHTDNKETIQPQNIRSLNSQRTADMAKGRPRLYSTADGKMLFETIADSAYPVSLSYFQKWDIETADVNWLITNAPDAYLYGSLLEAKAYAKSKEDVSMWAQGVSTAIDDLNNLDNRSRRNATARVDSALVRGRRFDINRGY
tara:strand:+ start:537 stop:1184 length:648 start_codon:yes stop_codon:yes gene_type:complete